MAAELEGRVALVTGAGNGIGKACALSLAAHGASVVVNDLGTSELGQGASATAADATVAEIVAAGGSAIASYDSVGDAAGCAAAVATAHEAYGRVDILVGCAGALLEANLHATDDEYQRFLGLFLSQKFWLSRAVVPGMVERGWGRIVTTTSYGATGLLGSPIFAASMGGVRMLTRAVALQCASQGYDIRVNTILPGAIHTEMVEGYVAAGVAAGGTRAAVLDGFASVHPMKRLGRPAEAADAIVFLASDEASFTTGSDLPVDGGYLA